MLISRHIFVEGLKLDAFIGLNDHEIGRTQPLVIDATLELSTRPILSLKDSVNYERVVECAKALIAQGHVGLVETFAEELAKRLLGLGAIASVEVTVKKPEALADAEAAGCSVYLAADDAP